MSEQEQTQPTPPAVQVVSPANLDADEAAALVAVLSALGGGGADDATAKRRSHWTGRARVGWRSSGLPDSRFVEHLPR